MNFNELRYWPVVLVSFLILLVVVLRSETRLFNFIRDYWFYKRSSFSYLSTLLFVLGFGGLLLGLLDIRGKEEKVKTAVPQDRTIILLDTSASMLAEDVKPSRLQKATLLAKHFARKAAGHQISVVAFAEVQKKIVPFTNDLDLIDSRLDSIEKLRNQYGSSALSYALQESIQYFKETGGDVKGNILVLTDGEETAEKLDFKVPKEVNVAFVGIGTERGGRIPLDDGRGLRFGHKKDRGRDVITKLNEKFFQEATTEIPSSKYWLANTYSLPSEEILRFFKAEKTKSESQQDMVIKPVLMEWVVVPSLLLLIISYLFKSIRIFTFSVILFVLPVHAQDPGQLEPQLNPEVLRKMDDLQQGKLDRLEKLKLADDLHRGGAKEEALSLYQENLPSGFDDTVPPEAYLNYGTSLLEKGRVKESLDVYEKLSSALEGHSEQKRLTDTMNKNVLTYFKQQQEQKKKEDQKRKDQSNKDQKGEDKDQSGNGSSKGQQGKSGQEKKDQKKESGQNNSEEKPKKNPEDSGEDKNEDDKKDDQKSEPKDNGEAEKLPPQKIPAKLKQLMSDDRQLQMKMIENGTRDLNRRRSRKSKDW